MRANIQYHNWHIGDLDVDRLTVQRGLSVYVLSFDFRVFLDKEIAPATASATAPAEESPAHVDVLQRTHGIHEKDGTFELRGLSATAYLKTGHASDERLFLGHAPCEDAIFARTRPTHRTQTSGKFKLPLRPEQLAAVEEARLTDPARTRHPEFALHVTGYLDRMAGAFSETVTLVGCEVAISCDLEHWLGQLSRVGFRRTLLFEVPLPEPNEAPHLKEAITWLQKARVAFDKGDFRGAVALCRDAIEVYHDESDRGNELQQIRSQIGDKTQSLTMKDLSLDQRCLYIEDSLYKYTHLAKHPDLGQKTVWDRRRAAYALSLLATILSFGAEDA